MVTPTDLHIFLPLRRLYSSLSRSVKCLSDPGGWAGSRLRYFSPTSQQVCRIESLHGRKPAKLRARFPSKLKLSYPCFLKIGSSSCSMFHSFTSRHRCISQAWTVLSRGSTPAHTLNFQHSCGRGRGRTQSFWNTQTAI